MKPNRNLAAVVLAFKDARPSILSQIILNIDASSAVGSNSGTSRGKRGREDNILVTQKMTYKSFHGKSKKYVKDTIDSLCSSSKVKPCLDGDQVELEKLYRELIHLNNAQLGSIEPMSFEDVIKEINKRESFKRKEAKNNVNAKLQAEKMIKGEVSRSLK